jgi:peptidoglycan/xylan/chitin deacetylase (PgdA/CDA1 family)
VTTVGARSREAPLFNFSVDVDYLPGTEAHARRLIDRLVTQGLSPTIFVAGQMAELIGDDLRRWAADGCEIGVHGWAHCQDPGEDFRKMGPAEQVALLERASTAIAHEVGAPPTLFRAPNLWVSDDIGEVLQTARIGIDSSIPSGRCDVVVGRIRTLRYLRAPRRPYELSPCDPLRRGDSGVVEVPTISVVIPINMMALRVFGAWLMATLTIRIARRHGYVLFYCHPAELASHPPGDARQVPRRHRYRTGVRAEQLLDDYLSRLAAAGLRAASLSEIVTSVGTP